MVNCARVAKINSHPCGSIQRLQTTHAYSQFSGFVLRFPSQHVVVAAVTIVQKGAHRTEKVQCGSKGLAHRFGEKQLLSGPDTLLVQGREQRKPASYVMVAQSARRLFDVGFEVKNSAAVFGVPRAGHLRELLDNIVPFPQKKLGQKFVVQTTEKVAIPGNIPAVEQRNSEFDVLRVELIALGQGPRSRTQLHPQVP